MIDPSFSNVNRLYVLSFENEDDRIFLKYYTPTIEIKEFNVVIDGKIVFDVPIKYKEQTYQRIIEMGRNNGYTTGNILDYEYFSNHYKLIAMDLSKQIELENPDLKLILLASLKIKQQCFSPLKKQQKQLIIFHRIL